MRFFGDSFRLFGNFVNFVNAFNFEARAWPLLQLCLPKRNAACTSQNCIGEHANHRKHNHHKYPSHEPNKAEHIPNSMQHAATHYLGSTGVQTVCSFPRDGIFAAGLAPAQVRDVHPNCALRAHFCACSGVERFN
jgi:hypothetical protein